MRCAFVIIAPFLLLVSYRSGRASITRRGASPVGVVGTRSSTSSGGGGGEVEGEGEGGSHVATAADIASGSRPFEYIGDIDPTYPRPWPESEVDWWAMHEKLVERVRISDDIPPPPPRVDVDSHSSSPSSHLPQLIFYGDSITEGWEGTSLGRPVPRYDGMGNLFDVTFGDGSVWGKRALRSPLLLGIGGSKTYDLIWRIENGEFPISRLVTREEKGGGRRREGRRSTS